MNIKDAYAVPVNHAIVSVVKKNAEEIFGAGIPVYGSTGGTDMSHVKGAGVPMCALGPGRPGNNVHSPDEHLPISDLVALTKVYALAALELLT